MTKKKPKEEKTNIKRTKPDKKEKRSEEEGRKRRTRGERGKKGERLGRRGVSKILRECKASNGRPPSISRPQHTTDHSICLLSFGNRGNGSDI